MQLYQYQVIQCHSRQQAQLQTADKHSQQILYIHIYMQGEPKKRTVFTKFELPFGLLLTYKSIPYIKLFSSSICSKTGMLHVTAFKYSLRNFSVITLS